MLRRHPPIMIRAAIPDARAAAPTASCFTDYILQLIDCNGDKYVYRRNGRTGTRGQGQLNGPMELDAAVAEFEKLFKSKTGQSWAGRVPGQAPSSSKHYTYLKTNWLARNDEDEAKWMYHLTRDPLGKPDGWYAYDDKAGAEVEELYVSFAVDGNTSMSVRCEGLAPPPAGLSPILHSPTST